MKKFILILRLLAAGILLQTLWFKFTGAPESVYIFTSLHAEPYGRWFAGLSELIAAILLIVPMTQLIGALMSMGIIAGAILSHIFVLGIVVQNDGGLLFALAAVVLICSSLIVILQKEELFKLPLVRNYVK